MKFSVAMCTYNGAAYLREQLDSIAAQARPPDELVICDDRSTDATCQIIEAFAAAVPFAVRLYVNEQNLGSTKNFEKAIRMCEGDIIALADQDDIWHADKLRRTEAAFSDGRVGLIFADSEVVDQRLRSLGWRTWQLLDFGEKKQRLCEAGRAFDLLLERNFVTGATMAFRSEFRELVLPLPTDIVHDGWKVIHDGWIALIISAVARLGFIADPMLKYRQHSQQQLGFRSVFEAEKASETSGATTTDIRAAAHRKNSYAGEIHYLRTIRERLSAKSDPARSKVALIKLETMITHFVARSEMPEARLSRVLPILRELLAFRYHLYSNGIRSAAKDVWL